MAILGTLLKNGIIQNESLEQEYSTPAELQQHQLRKLLIKCRNTAFGKYYHFDDILRNLKHPDYYESFRRQIPIHDYNKMYEDWWKLSHQGVAHITWPGKVKYFALSSGTSGSTSKHIPVTGSMLKSIRKTGLRQMLTLRKYDFDYKFFTKGILTLGGSTDLRKEGEHYEGDLSGIATSNAPYWFQFFQKPGKKISKNQWEEKLEEIAENAPSWDIGVIAGVPAWLQIMMEKIIDRYQVEHIHQIWPNLKVFVHGGVSFEPYKRGFEKLLGQPLTYIETYLASEGFIGYQSGPAMDTMKLVLNNGIFYEFIPFNEQNFSSDGELLEGAETLKIDEVEVSVDYALLLTNNAGAWRYLIGDVIRFESVEETEIKIVGRTRHFLSLCGEHVSLDNINKAIERTEAELGIDIREFTVCGENVGNRFGHTWYVGIDQFVPEEILTETVDRHMKLLNDDYATERNFALSEMKVNRLSSESFYEWLRQQGKVGGSFKFPRVLKGEKIESWKTHLSQHSYLRR